jgi:hypothetical protein
MPQWTEVEGRRAGTVSFGVHLESKRTPGQAGKFEKGPMGTIVVPESGRVNVKDFAT